MSLRYAVFDIETSSRPMFSKKFHPLDTLGEVTCYTAILSNGRGIRKYAVDGLSRDNHVFDWLDEVDILVGHNLKFDLLPFWRNKSLQSFFKRCGRIWDTMVAEYLLHGQDRELSLKLDDLSAKYGGTNKSAEVKAHYEADGLSKELPKDQLLEYNAEDVINTLLIFKKQHAKARKLGMLTLIDVYCQHTLALCEMEYNGMHIDVPAAEAKLVELESQLKGIIESANSQAISLGWPADQEFSLASNKQVSTLMFGGTIETKRKEHVGEYKSGSKKGTPKYQNVTSTELLPGLLIPKEEWSCFGGRQYKVDGEVFEELLRGELDDYVRTFINTIYEYRDIDKLISTYYYREILDKEGEVRKTSGLLKNVMPSTHTIHTEFMQCLTVTGRLSSTRPNMQNISPQILYMFDSRWGANGELVEFDFHTLEVILQAYLTQCEKMIEAIKDDVDFHRLRLSYAEGLSYEEVVNIPDYDYKRKTIAKPISFAKSYGASAATIAKKANIDEAIVKSVFAKEAIDFPEIELYYNDLAMQLSASRIVKPHLIKIRDKATGLYHTNQNDMAAVGVFTSVTKKRYIFDEKATFTKHRKVFRHWPMTDVQNYPVQGLAADIVALQIGRVFKYLQNHRDKCRMVNEIHDSLILDVKKEHKELIIKEVHTIMSSVKESLAEVFGLDFNVPIEVDFKSGINWMKAKE